MHFITLKVNTLLITNFRGVLFPVPIATMLPLGTKFVDKRTLYFGLG